MCCILGIRHLQLAGPIGAHMAQQCLSHVVPDDKRNQGTVHLGRCPAHQAYWPRYQATCGMGGVENGGLEMREEKKKTCTTKQ